MFDSDTLLLDPSILVSENTDKGLQTGIASFSGTESDIPYVSETFRQVVLNSDGYSDDKTFDFFIGRLNPNNLLEYSKLVDITESLRPYGREQIERKYEIDYEAVRQVFKDRYPSATKGQVADIMYEEFVFLAEQSQVPSRSQKSPDVDIDGVRLFSLSESELEDVLDQAPGNYTTQLRARKQKTGWNYITTMGSFDALFKTDDPLGRTLVSIGLTPGLLAVQYDP